MKNILLSLLTCSMLFVACSPKNSVSSIDDTGESVFNLIKQLDDIEAEEYEKHFITYEQFLQLMKKSKSNDDKLKEMIDNKLYGAEELRKLSKKFYERLKSIGQEKNIEWAEIEFIDYDYHIELEDGLEMIAGETTFSYENTTYIIYSSSFQIENKFVLANINRLDEAK